LLPAAAVPALAGMAASVCLAPQALADQAPAQTAAHSATVDASVLHVGMTPADLLSAMQPAAGQAPAKARTSYKVKAGDSLSSIARQVYHKENAWPVLYWANHKTIHWANIISEDQVLKVPALPAKIPAAPSQLGPVAPAPAPAPVAAAPASTSTSTSTSSSGYSGSRSSSSSSSSYSSAPSGSYESCVIARESGGNAQVMNSSGHYGLYQFSSSTWRAYGGSAASFGNASAAEQHRVFANAMAQGGQSNWSPYDGC
jgi:transglycosylase-like protein